MLASEGHGKPIHTQGEEKKAHRYRQWGKVCVISVKKNDRLLSDFYFQQSLS